MEKEFPRKDYTHPTSCSIIIPLIEPIISITFHLTIRLFTIQLKYKLQAASHIYIKEKTAGKIKIFSPVTQNTRPQATFAFSFSTYHTDFFTDASPTKRTHGTLHAYSLLALYVLRGLIFSLSTLFALFQSSQHHSFAIFTNYEHESDFHQLRSIRSQCWDSTIKG